MNFWEKIKEWLQLNGEIEKDSKVNGKKLNADKEPGDTTAIFTDDPGDVITPADTAIDVFQILFSHKNKHIATMLNSISLSSDMKTLYLIDNGRAIPFDLTVPEGVLVGLLGKQLVVATAVSPPPVLETVPDGDLSGDGTIRPQLRGQGRADRPERYTYKANKDSQYTVTYNEGHQTLGIIGFDDVVISIEAPEDHVCKEHRFEMKNNKLVRLLHREDVLEIFQEAI